MGQEFELGWCQCRMVKDVYVRLKKITWRYIRVAAV